MNMEAKILLIIFKYRRIMLGELANTSRYSRESIIDVITRNQDSLKIINEEVIVVDPLKLAYKLLNLGVELKRISEFLEWRDFEVFSSRILSEFGYEVQHHIALTTPVKFEIDVLGIDPATGLALMIDCKHWSTMSPSRLIEASRRHYERVVKFAKYKSYLSIEYKIVEKVKSIIPLVVTLTTPSLRLHENVLIISIRELPVFLQNIHSILDYFKLKPINI